MFFFGFFGERLLSAVSYLGGGLCGQCIVVVFAQVKVLGPRYWPIVFHRDKNWDKIQ